MSMRADEYEVEQQSAWQLPQRQFGGGTSVRCRLFIVVFT
jgi:hypothetical protein